MTDHAPNVLMVEGKDGRPLVMVEPAPGLPGILIDAGVWGTTLTIPQARAIAAHLNTLADHLATPDPKETRPHG